MDFIERCKAVVSPLARLIAILQLDTDDTRLLAEVVR
jgi:hypothetical protein